MNLESEISSLEEQLRIAMLHSDLTVLDALIADGLLFVGPDGSVIGKAEDLELHRSGTQHISQLDFAGLRVRAHGGTAVTTVAAAVAGTFSGQPFSAHLRYLRTWTRTRTRAGWQVIGGSASLIASQGS